MKFTKMQGLGNDYVYVNCFEETVNDPEKLAIAVSDRHFGIGSDGLILITPSEVADCRMDMYNLDGSRGAMCGNGIRCVGKYAYDHHIVDKPQISVETLSGIKYLDMKVENGKVTAVTVDMGEPEQTSELPEKIEVDGTEYEFTGISMGNPHAVLFMDEIDSLDLETIGPKFEFHKRFPDRTNTRLEIRASTFGWFSTIRQITVLLTAFFSIIAFIPLHLLIPESYHLRCRRWES